jgi:hypothetical protein
MCLMVERKWWQNHGSHCWRLDPERGVLVQPPMREGGDWCLSILLDVLCSCQLELMWMLQQQRRLAGVCLQLPLRSSTSLGWEETNGGVSRLFVC